MIPLEPVEYSLGQRGTRIFAHHKQDKLFVRGWIEDALPSGYSPATGPIGVSLQFYLSPRKEQFVNCRKQGDLYTEVPDLSNLVKFIEDSMTGLVYVDDRQIVKYFEPFKKEYDPENPRTEIIIYDIL